jgi:two-component system sensor histidine kinase PhoQ
MLASKPSYSLYKRLISLMTIALIIGFVFSGWILNSAFQQGMKANIEDKLQLQMLTLLSLAEVENETIIIPETLPDPRFNQPSSGLYAVVFDSIGNELWRSNSAISLTFTDLKPLAVGNSLFRPLMLQNEPYFMLGLGTVWETEQNDINASFYIFEHQSTFLAASQQFQHTLWQLWALLLLLLVFLQWQLLRWGLKPLKQLAKSLITIEQGKAQQIHDDYPQEIQPLTKSLNHLIASEQQQRQRYKDRMADLAHSLKTPLAILTSIKQLDQQALDEIQTQVQRMVHIVNYQLQRAVIGNQTLTFKQVNIAAVVQQIHQALAKVYQDKQVSCELVLDETLTFRGDESDLTEIIANVMDNAFKYGAGKVKVTVQKDASNNTVITVEDNGVGIEPSAFEQVLKRGQRLDTQQRGQGIGLSVVHELVQHYYGQLRLDSSSLLGAKISIIFP